MAKSWVLLLLFSCLTGALPGDLCYLRDHRTAIVNQRLFWMSGLYTFDGGDAIKPQQKLYWLDLTTNISLSGSLSRDVINSIDAPAGSPWQDSGAFFYDDTTLYLYAGMPETGAPVDTVWSYNTSTDKWTEGTVVGGKLNFGSRRNAWFASELTWKRSFYLGGGTVTGGVIGGSVKGLLVFEAQDPRSLAWMNKTSSVADDGETVPNNLEGRMVYVGMGKEGVLLGIGGYDISKKADKDAVFDGYAYKPMDEISVYDIESSSWYTVTATGDIPGGQAQFCAAAFSSPDSSSFQVYMYGGWRYNSSSTNEEVYILTVPSFRWIKVATANNAEAELGAGTGKALAHCIAWHERTMFAIGGNINLGTDLWDVNTKACNESYPPIRILDTSELAWKTQYSLTSSRKPYFVPKAVYDIIGGDSSGKATENAPASGWKNRRLSTIFSQTVQPPLKTASNPHPTNAVGGELHTNGSSATNTGTIAGGVVGGVLGVVLVIGLAFWFRRQRRTLPAEMPPDNMRLELDSKPLAAAELHGKSVQNPAELPSA